MVIGGVLVVRKHGMGGNESMLMNASSRSGSMGYLARLLGLFSFLFGRLDLVWGC